MDLAFNAEELAFQKEVRDWITANMPTEVAEESRRSRTSRHEASTPRNTSVSRASR